MEFKKMDEIQKRILMEVADLHSVPEGAFNIRSDGQLAGRANSANIEITSKENGKGIDIRIKDGTKNESVHIPVILSKSGLHDVVYNDFYVGENCDVIIVAGCGISNCGGMDSEHDGIHRFFVEKNARVKYVEKHYGEGDGTGKRILNPVTEVYMKEGSHVEMEMVQIKGVDSTDRSTVAKVAAGASLVVKERLMDAAVSCGYSQGYMYSFESPKAFDMLGIPADSELRRTVVISNPLGEDYSIMRTQTVNGMLTSLSTNFNRRIPAAKLFEAGNVYLPHDIPITELPDEKMMLTLGSYNSGDFYHTKGDVESILKQIGMKDEFEYVPDPAITYLHPGKSARILYHKKEIGLLGEVHPTVAERYSIGKRTYIAVLDLSVITGMAKFEPKYKPLAKFPATLRDLSFVVPESVLAGEISATIKRAAGRTLESCSLFDLYQGDQIEKGYKSMAYTLTFRASDHTLKDEEVSGIIDKVLKKLEEKGITLREI